MFKKRGRKRSAPEGDTSGPARVTCPLCGKGFKQEHSLQLHTRTHTGETPYPCPHCDKSFAQNAALTVHIRTHTGERPFNCNKCNKSFSRADHLHQHDRTHTGEKPYACKVCGKTFGTWSAVSRHHAEHFSQAKHVCSVCNKAFARADNYRSHISRKHAMKYDDSDTSGVAVNKDDEDSTNEVDSPIKTENEEFVFEPHFLVN